MVARQGVLSAQISSALRRLLGARTRADEVVGSGMQVKVVGTHGASSRFLFCVVGPHSVDLATLWLSPSGLPLCSCWGHTQNVALLLLTGEASSCWHAIAFKSAMDGMPDERAALQEHLQVADGVEPSAVDIRTDRGWAAAAFDGALYSPVVATRRRDIKCVAVSCRSHPRRCHHAQLVKDMPRFEMRTNEDADESDVTCDDGDGPRPGEESNKNDAACEDVDDEELVSIAKERRKRNLLPCTEEDKQGLKWARTAEWAADDLAATPLFSSSLSARTGETEAPATSVTMLQRMAELDLVFDATIPLCEKTCSLCGAAKPDDSTLDTIQGQLYTDGNSAQPLPVRLLCLFTVMHCCEWCLSSLFLSVVADVHVLTGAFVLPCIGQSFVGFIPVDAGNGGVVDVRERARGGV